MEFNISLVRQAKTNKQANMKRCAPVHTKTSKRFRQSLENICRSILQHLRGDVRTAMNLSSVNRAFRHEIVGTAIFDHKFKYLKPQYEVLILESPKCECGHDNGRRPGFERQLASLELSLQILPMRPALTLAVSQNRGKLPECVKHLYSQHMPISHIFYAVFYYRLRHLYPDVLWLMAKLIEDSNVFREIRITDPIAWFMICGYEKLGRKRWVVAEMANTIRHPFAFESKPRNVGHDVWYYQRMSRNPIVIKRLIEHAPLLDWPTNPRLDLDMILQARLHRVDLQFFIRNGTPPNRQQLCQTMLQLFGSFAPPDGKSLVKNYFRNLRRVCPPEYQRIFKDLVFKDMKILCEIVSGNRFLDELVRMFCLELSSMEDFLCFIINKHSDDVEDPTLIEIARLAVFYAFRTKETIRFRTDRLKPNTNGRFLPLLILRNYGMLDLVQ